MKLKPLKYKSINEVEKLANFLAEKIQNINDFYELFDQHKKYFKIGKNFYLNHEHEDAYINLIISNFLYDCLQKLKGYDKKYCDLMIGENILNEKFKIISELKDILFERYKEKSTNILITCKELFNELTTECFNNIKILLLDLRSTDDFSKSYIANKSIDNNLVIINIPEEKIEKGFTCQQFQSILFGTDLENFSKRNSFKKVVLLDNDSLQSNEKLNIVFQALTKFDNSEDRLKERPFILKGGYNQWILSYPQMCSDPTYENFSKKNKYSGYYNSKRFNNTFITETKFCYEPIDSNINYDQLNNNLNESNCDKAYIRNKDFIAPGSAVYVKNDLKYKNKQNDKNISENENFYLENKLKNLNLKSSIFNNNLRFEDDYDINNRRVIYHPIHLLNNEENLIEPSLNSSCIDEKLEKQSSKINQNDYILNGSNLKKLLHNSNIEFTQPSINKGLSKSYTNIAESFSEDESNKDLTSGVQLFSSIVNKPMFDRTNKPSHLINNFTSKPSQTVFKSRNLAPIYGTSGQPTGLRNLGNTCFMNAVIQCLFNTKDFSNYFHNEYYYKDINQNSKFGTGGELTVEFAVLMAKLGESTQIKHISPKDFRRVVGEYINAFSGYEQQDSHEFLLYLFEKLHADLNKTESIENGIKLENLDNLSSEQAITKFWDHHLLINNSIVSRLFEGLIMSSLECEICSKTSDTFEVFTSLSLPVFNSSSGTRYKLIDCLKEFTKTETLYGEAAWECPNCKTKRSAKKKTSIVKLPKVLIIHFKRFSYDGRWKQKITNFIEFPITDLNLRHFTQYQSSNFTYDLIGIVDHFGSLEGGHYTAICKSERNGLVKWHKYDDQDVTEISQNYVVSKEAYLLFYVLN